MGTTLHFYYSISGDYEDSYEVPSDPVITVNIIAAPVIDNADAVIASNVNNANSYNSYSLDVTCT